MGTSIWEMGVASIGGQKGRWIEVTATPDCSEDSGSATCSAVMAIDDLQLVNSQTSNSDFGCNFENNTFCSWQQDQLDDSDWEMSEGPDAQNIEMGHFLRLKNEDSKSQMATLESTVLPPDQQYCFTFKYKMYGDTMGSLKLALKSQTASVTEPQVVWQHTGPDKNQWVKAFKQFKPSTPVSLLLQGEAHGKYSPIDIDLLKLKMGVCPKRSSCGFENGLCHWRQRGDVKWLVGSGLSTQGLPFTPDHDFTSKSSVGRFRYTSPIDSAGQKAILEYDAWMNGTKCLNIWYVSRDNDGFLVVRQRYKDGQANNITERIWEMPKYSLPSWQLAQITLEDKDGYSGYKAQIYSTIGTKNTSTMAIDDVKIREGACPPLDHCSFEEGTCGYGNFISDQFDWIPFSASEGSDFVAPPTDKTLDSTEGHSFIAPISGHKRGDQATFITSLIPKKYQCIVFWYVKI